MSFKHFLEEEVKIKIPKPYKTEVTLNLNEYKEYVGMSCLSSKKKLQSRLELMNGDFPIYCTQSKRFFMATASKNKFKAREIKSRDDKELTGILMNGMMISEAKKGSIEVLNEFKTIRTNWDVPDTVYKQKDQFGKMVDINID